MKIFKILIAASAAFAVSHDAISQERIERVFRCSETLNEPYGICAHISLRSDYDIRDKDLALIESLGINYVRSDFNWEDHFNGKSFFPRYTDGVTQSIRKTKVKFLPIIGKRVNGKFAWEDMSGYTRYVDWLLKSYGDTYDHWELMNEIDIATGAGKNPEEIAMKYASILPDMRKLTASYGKKLLIGGMSACYGNFCTTLGKVGALRHFDAMNFHHYTGDLPPESGRYAYEQTAKILNAAGQNKETWVTETGYHTEQSTKDNVQFFENIVPAALAKLGIKRGATIAVIADYGQNFLGATEQQCEILRDKGYALKFITLDEIGTQDVNDTPVLLPTATEYFPLRYSDQLTSYVRKGGTIVISCGAPFFYDIKADGSKTIIGNTIQKKLHMETLYWWDAKMKAAGLPTTPTVIKKSPVFKELNYDWQPESDGSTRYIDEGNMHKGDRLIPIVSAGNARKQWVVTGIYRLNSDMRGNIIVHTNSLPGRNVTETLQAKRLARSYMVAFAMGVSKLFWYNLRSYENSQTDMEDHFGITRKDLSPKPAYYAYKAMTNNMPNGSTRPVVTFDKKQDLYKATWTKPDGRKVTAYWTTMGDCEVRLPNKSTKYEIYDYLGNRIKAKGKTLEISNGITYCIEK